MASSLFHKQKTNLSPEAINRVKTLMNNAGEMQKIMGGLNGMNPEQAVRMICQQRGIDVDDFMSQLQLEFANSNIN